MINDTATVMFLLPVLGVLECYKIAMVRLAGLFASQPSSNSSLFINFNTYSPDETTVLVYIELVLAVSTTSSKREMDTAERDLLGLIGVRKAGASGRMQLRQFAKTFLIVLYQEKCVLLPYGFTRPLIRWLDNMGPEAGCYSEVMLAFREMDTVKATGVHSGRPYDAEEKRARRIFQLGTKLALASTWYTPEGITFEDFKEWRKVEAGVSGICMKVSPLPLTEIAEVLRLKFKDRLCFQVGDMRDALYLDNGRSAIDKLSARIHEDGLAACLKQIEDPLLLVQKILTDLKLAARSFMGEGPIKLELVKCWAGVGVDLSESVTVWLKLENEFIETERYEKCKPWYPLFGRFNLYIFIYLPAWFRIHSEATIKYPDAPNKFLGRIFYKSKILISGDRPLSFVEFWEALGYKYNYNVASNLRTFFKNLIDFAKEVRGCENLSQPVWWLPAVTKAVKTNKYTYTDEHEELYIRFLNAIASAEPLLDKHVRGFKPRPYLRTGAGVDFEELGYLPFVTVNGKNLPIHHIDRRALILVKVDGKMRYNPATTNFPYCLIRGGLRGQNLQWLSADSYSLHVDRELDEQVGITYLYVNTDKIRTVPFHVHCRYSVMARLDSQAAWRKNVFKETGAPGFNTPYFYDGNRGSRWSSINCLFCNDAITGEPVKDSAYTQALTYSQLAFQTWMRDAGETDLECVAFIGVPPPSKHRKKDFYTWEQWQEARKKSSVAKVAVFDNAQVGKANYCPVYFRSKMTGHGGRATHITKLLAHLTPEEVAKTTGQTRNTVIYYDTGRDDFRRRFAGVVNNKEPVKQLLVKRDLSTEVVDALLAAKDSQAVNGLLIKFGLQNFSDLGFPGSNSVDIFNAIANEKSANIVQGVTNICVKGFVCPKEVVERYKGRKICPWCSFSIFSLNGIFAIAAKRHQLAEDFQRIQKQITSFRNKLSEAQMKVLESELKDLSEELIAWYFLERTIDALIVQRSEIEKGSGYIANDRRLVVSEVSRHVVERGSSEDFLRRLDEVLEFPTTMSSEFRDKVNRAVRLVLAQRGNVYEALIEPVAVNPEARLVSLLRDDIQDSGFDMDKFTALLRAPHATWFDHVANLRKLKSEKG